MIRTTDDAAAPPSAPSDVRVGTTWLQRRTYRAVQWMLRVVGRVFWGVRTSGRENVPREGAVLLAVSHESVLDPMLVGSFVPRFVRYLARNTLFGKRVKDGGAPALHGRVLLYAGAVPIEREGGGARAVLRTARTLLGAGEAMLIFPEGTRSSDGRLQRFRRGAGMIARATGCVVVPVSIEGAHALWPRGRRFPKLFGGPVRIAFGAPVRYTRDDAAEAIALDLRERVLELRSDEQRAREVPSEQLASEADRPTTDPTSTET